MKNKKVSMILLTLAIAGAGAGFLFCSSNWIMADVQEKMGSAGDIVAVDKVATENDTVLEEENYPLQEDYYAGLASISTASFVYYGQEVYVKDDKVEKEVAIENATKIMDYVFNEIDTLLLTPYQIDKTKYTYSIQRQSDENRISYGVFLMEKGRIQCTIGVRLDDGIEMDAFARDGLIQLYGDEEHPIPKEYLSENWCNNRQKKEDIYDAYYEKSKEIIENVLGLASIDDSYRDVSKKSCFSVDDIWSTVTFGYHLTDGTEITVFYNRVNGMWDGFCIK